MVAELGIVVSFSSPCPDQATTEEPSRMRPTTIEGMPALLARSAPRSERDPDLEAATASLAIMQIARTEFEIFQVVRALALALGSVRTESGTIKAVHAVLLQLDRPGMSEKEAYTTTGASLSNFKKWRRRVHHAQLDLPPAP